MDDQSNMNDMVTAFLRERIAAKVEIQPEGILPSTKLVDTGLQSIDAVIVCGEAEDEFGVEIDPSIIFEHDALESFAGYIVTLIEEKS